MKRPVFARPARLFACAALLFIFAAVATAKASSVHLLVSDSAQYERCEWRLPDKSPERIILRATSSELESHALAFFDEREDDWKINAALTNAGILFCSPVEAKKFADFSLRQLDRAKLPRRLIPMLLQYRQLPSFQEALKNLSSSSGLSSQLSGHLARLEREINSLDKGQSERRASVSSRAAGPPPLPYEDAGACPFECCTYREWETQDAITLQKDPDMKSPLLVKIPKGTKILALTGKVVTIKPGEFLVQRTREVYKENEVLQLYTNKGEGFYLVWHNGKMQDVDLGCCSDGSVPGCFTSNDKDCWGKVLSLPVSTWWAKVQLPGGATGWTKETGKFSNQDACG